MKNNSEVLFIDDDANFVSSAYEKLSNFLEGRFKCNLVLLSGITELEDYVTAADSEPVTALIDLWMVGADQVEDTQAGLKCIHFLRKKWPKSYLVVYSSHIGIDSLTYLKDIEQLLILDKVISIGDLYVELERLIKELR